jgi:Secretion system C-terminal sorting domain
MANLKKKKTRKSIKQLSLFLNNLTSIKMKKKLQLTLFLLAFFSYTTKMKAQVILNADGPGNTYELINSVLAPGYNAVEAPDVTHSAFGRHIAELFDATLNKNVFEFYAHLSNDDDPSTGATDRQRVEIKTYDQSPANLLGVSGETVTYKWRFKIAAGFQPSDNFTHLHQIKPVGGDDADPIFTLTARKGFAGGPNKMQLTYTEASALSSTVLQQVDLSLFEDTWVEATEKIEYSTTTTGKYSLVVRKISDNSLVMSFAKLGLITIRPDNTFARPKWGIYRSILVPGDLRDETVRFSDFSIAEGAASFTQTYYWVGGVGGVGITGFNLSDGTKWNTIQNGTGVLRSDVSAITQIDDILIIDGTNIGGTTPTTGLITVNITGNTYGQLILQNSANVLMKRSGGTTGNIVIGGDGTSAPDFVVNSGCTLTINNDVADGNITINLPSPATGLVNGTMVMAGTGQHRITAQTTNGLVFAAGASFTSSCILASGANTYAFGSNSQGVQNGVQFMAGSSLIITGNRSPFGATSTFQNCNMMPGSNTYFRTTNAASTGSWTNLKTFGNVFIQSNPSGNILTSDGPLYKVDTLTIDAGNTFITHSSGNTPILGNLTVNGTYTTAAGSNALVLGGSVPQTVSGGGTMTVINLIVANYSDVTLARSIPVTGSTNIYGKINFGTTHQLTGAGTISTKVQSTAASVTGNTTAGSYQVTGVTGALSGNTGLIISGGGLSSNTNVVGFSSTNVTINLSKPALTTTTGTTFTFTNDSATLVTAHINGLDTLTGSVVQTGSKSFATGTNVIINAATNKPFAISTGNTNYMQLGNLTFNAPTTTNYNVRVRGTLTLNNGNLNIRSVDTIRLTSGTAIAGTPFSSAKYIVTQSSATQTGVLRMDNLTGASLFPIGTTSNYLPVTLTPTSTMSYAVSAFPGLTVDGSITGAAAASTVVDESVNTTWTINRTGGSGDCAVKLDWPTSLEGVNFVPLPDNQIGISRYNGTSFLTGIGVGDNTANTATATFTGFSPFMVTKTIATVPVTFIRVEASALVNSNVIKWTVADEYNLNDYNIEKSSDGINFAVVGTVLATRSMQYTFTDAAIAHVTYYRISANGFNGYKKLSVVLVVRRNTKPTIQLYPNPVIDVFSIAGLEADSEIKIKQLNGQWIKQYKTTATVFSVNVATLQPNMYIVEVYNSMGVLKLSQKIIKQ